MTNRLPTLLEPMENLGTSPLPLTLMGLYLLCGLAGTGLLFSFYRNRDRHLAHLRQRAGDLCQRPWRDLDAAVLLGVIAFGLSLLVLVLRLTRAPDTPSKTLLMLLESLVLHGGVLLTILLLLRGRHVPWPRAFGFRRSDLIAQCRVALALYLASLPLLFIASIGVHAIATARDLEVEPQEVLLAIRGTQSPWALAYFVFLAVGLGPLVEELFFRGVLLPVAARRLGILPAVILVSAVFALLHNHAFSALPLFLIGTGFSLAYLYSGSLLPSILMHSLFNGVNLIILFTVLSPAS